MIKSLIIPVRSLLFQGILNNRIKDIAANSIRNGGKSQWKAQMVIITLRLSTPHPQLQDYFLSRSKCVIFFVHKMHNQVIYY